MTERAEETESTESTEEYRETEAMFSALSVLSVSREVKKALAAAIESTLPSYVGQRNRSLFEFARTLKAIPALADAQAQDLRDIVKLWHRQALPVIGTKPFDDTWAEFVYCWAHVKFPKGEEPMTRMLANAEASDLPLIALNYESPDTHLLIKLCRELQRASGSGPFYLSCRTAGNLLGVDHTHAWKQLGMLVCDGVIQIVEPGTKIRATRYRYIAPDD